MPSKILFLWATRGGFAAARGPQKGISGAAAPPPNPTAYALSFTGRMR